MDQHYNNNEDDQFSDGDWQQQQDDNDNDSETDELGLRIAAHAQRRGEEEAQIDPNYRPETPPSPFELRLREAAKGRGDRWALQNQPENNEKESNKPLFDRLNRLPKNREPFFRAKDRFPNGRPKQHIRAVSDGHQQSSSPPPSATDPPITVPLQWGSRSRVRANWLHRGASSGDVGLVESVKRVDEDTIHLYQTKLTGDDDIIVAGEDVMVAEGSGGTPMSARRKRQFSSPSSLRHMNSTMQDGGAEMLEDGENDELSFNDASVIVSTPAPPPPPPVAKNRNRKIDELMKGETISERPANRKTTDRTLEDEKRPAMERHKGIENNPFPQRQRNLKITEEKAEDEERPVSQRPAIIKTTERKLEDEERPVSQRPADLKPTKRTPGEGERRIMERVRFNENEAKAHGRNDSIDLLRRIARASSLTPSPVGGKVVKIYPPHKDPVSNLRDKDPRRINSEPSHPKSALEAILAGRGGASDNLGDSTIASLEDIVNPNIDNSTLATEEVLGAGKAATVEEENDKGSEGGEERRRKEEREFEHANQRLRVARTSIKDADRGLRRLENRLESTPDAGPLIAEPVAESTTNTTKSRKEEATDVLPTPSFPPGFTPYTDHNGRTLCHHCGGCYTSVWRGLWVEFRDCFYTWVPEKKKTPNLQLSATNGEVVAGPTKLQITWLGWILAAWFAWIGIEMIMETILEPWIYGVRFPFITISLLWRAVCEPREVAGWIAEAAGNWIFGDSEAVTGSVVGTTSAWARRVAPTPGRANAAAGGNGDWVAAAAAATSRVVERVGKGLDEAGGSMWDDEYF